MTAPLMKSAPLFNVLGGCLAALQSIEDGLWRRMKVLEEGNREASNRYEDFDKAHDLVEDIRIDVKFAGNGLPTCLIALMVSFTVQRTEGKPGRRLQFDNALAALASVQAAAQAHADNRNTPEEERAEVLEWLTNFKDVDVKSAAVRFPY